MNEPALDPNANLISAEGLVALHAEIEQLEKEGRPKIAKAIGAAAAEGDLSENAGTCCP